MTVALGGPGVACSAMLVRRLEAGELGEAEARRVRAHLEGCARCQAVARELEAERAALAAELPFETFAAGVGERLASRAAGEAGVLVGAASRSAAGGASGTAAAARSAPPAWRRAVPLALAAALALGVAAPLLSRLVERDRPFADDATRVKGGASAALWLREGEGARALEPGEPVPAGAALRLTLAPAGRRFVAAALRDEDGAVLLSAGPAAAGPGQAFEWTGRRGEVVVVYDDRPVDGAALLARLQRGGPAAAAPGPGAEVLVLPLARRAR